MEITNGLLWFIIYMSTTMFLVYIVTPIHEAGHVLTTKLFGCRGIKEVVWFSLKGGAVVYEDQGLTLPKNNRFHSKFALLLIDGLIGIAGGFFGAIFFILLRLLLHPLIYSDILHFLNPITFTIDMMVIISVLYSFFEAVYSMKHSLFKHHYQELKPS